jgi:hypothetical protein
VQLGYEAQTPDGKRGKVVREGVHRLLLWMLIGPPQHANQVCIHLCDNKKCVNPMHLVWASRAQNCRGDAAAYLEAQQEEAVFLAQREADLVAQQEEAGVVAGQPRCKGWPGGQALVAPPVCKHEGAGVCACKTTFKWRWQEVAAAVDAAIP